MHVQGISHWAPANIGPYSQAIKVQFVIPMLLTYAVIDGGGETFMTRYLSFKQRYYKTVLS